jgi:hypothetical protein
MGRREVTLRSKDDPDRHDQHAAEFNRQPLLKVPQRRCHIGFCHKLGAAANVGECFSRGFGVLGLKTSLVAQPARWLQRVERSAGHGEGSP